MDETEELTTRSYFWPDMQQDTMSAAATSVNVTSPATEYQAAYSNHFPYPITPGSKSPWT